MFVAGLKGVATPHGGEISHGGNQGGANSEPGSSVGQEIEVAHRKVSLVLFLVHSPCRLVFPFALTVALRVVLAGAGDMA